MKLYFVRHGETPCLEEGRFQGRSDRPGLNDLSPKGKETAERLARFFAGVEIRRIYSSPLRRTMETARIIARRRGLTPVPDDRLIEVDYGDWEARRNEEVYNTPEARERARDKFRYRHKGGESYEDVHARVSAFLDEVMRGRAEGPLLIVGHAGTIRTALIRLGVWTVDEAMGRKPDHDVVYEFDTESRRLTEHPAPEATSS